MKAGNTEKKRRPLRSRPLKSSQGVCKLTERAEIEFGTLIFKIWQLGGNSFNDFVLFFISEQHRKLKIKKSRGGNCLLLPQCSYAYDASNADCYSYLFWSDGTNGDAKIERSGLSGHNRTVLVSSAQGLVSPTTLVVDFSSQKLYWLDSAAEKIGWVNFDGSEPSTQTISGLGHMSAMTVYGVRTQHCEF